MNKATSLVTRENFAVTLQEVRDPRSLRALLDAAPESAIKQSAQQILRQIHQIRTGDGMALESMSIQQALGRVARGLEVSIKDDFNPIKRLYKLIGTFSHRVEHEVVSINDREFLDKKRIQILKGQMH